MTLRQINFYTNHSIVVKTDKGEIFNSVLVRGEKFMQGESSGPLQSAVTRTTPIGKKLRPLKVDFCYVVMAMF